MARRPDYKGGLTGLAKYPLGKTIGSICLCGLAVPLVPVLSGSGVRLTPWRCQIDTLRPDFSISKKQHLTSKDVLDMAGCPVTAEAADRSGFFEFPDCSPDV